MFADDFRSTPDNMGDLQNKRLAHAAAVTHDGCANGVKVIKDGALAYPDAVFFENECLDPGVGELLVNQPGLHQRHLRFCELVPFGALFPPAAKFGGDVTHDERLSFTRPAILGRRPGRSFSSPVPALAGASSAEGINAADNGKRFWNLEK
jgi:hypothetical protein